MPTQRILVLPFLVTCDVMGGQNRSHFVKIKEWSERKIQTPHDTPGLSDPKTLKFDHLCDL